MGNEPSSRKRQHSVRADDLKKDFPVLTATFVEHATKVVGEKKYLTEENLTKGLFAKIPDFGSAFFQKYHSEDDLSVDLMTFLNIGSQFSSQGLNSSPENLLKFYAQMFSSKEQKLSGDEVSKFFKVLMQSSLAICKINSLDVDFDKTTQAFINAALGRTNNPDENSISVEDFCQWMIRHLPFGVRDLHDHVVYRLLKRTNVKKNLTNTESADLSVIYKVCSKNESIVGMSGLWLVSSFAPPSFVPPSELGNLSNLSRVLEDNGWHVLYDSNKQGLSANGFTHKVLGYPGPTLTYFRFGAYLLLLGLDTEWRESHVSRGKYDCFLLQLLPEFKVIQSNVEESVHFNLTNRTIKRGITVYRDKKILFELDSDFSQVTYNMNTYNISRLEVWGCGGSANYEKYAGQKLWESKDTARHQNRKLRHEDWKDNPDKELLSYGGIETDHAKRGDL